MYIQQKYQFRDTYIALTTLQTYSTVVLWFLACCCFYKVCACLLVAVSLLVDCVCLLVAVSIQFDCVCLLVAISIKFVLFAGCCFYTVVFACLLLFL